MILGDVTRAYLLASPDRDVQSGVVNGVLCGAFYAAMLLRRAKLCRAPSGAPRDVARSEDAL